MTTPIDPKHVICYYHQNDEQPIRVWPLLIFTILALAVALVMAIGGPQNTYWDEIEIRIFTWSVVAIFGIITLVLSFFLGRAFKAKHLRNAEIKYLLANGAFAKATITKQFSDQVKMTNQGATGNFFDYTYLDQNNTTQTGSAFIRSFAPLEQQLEVDIIYYGHQSIMVRLKNSEAFKEKLNQEHTYFKPPRN